MSTKRLITLSLPILIIVGGLALANQGGNSSTAHAPGLQEASTLELPTVDSMLTELRNHIQVLASKDSGIRETEPTPLLAKKGRRAAAKKGFKPVEEQELAKSRPKSKPPAIKKRPSKQQLEQLIQNNKKSKKAAQNAQMLSNAKKRKPSGRLRKAAPQDFKSKEEQELAKSRPKSKPPAIKKRRPRAMGLDSLPIMNEPETPTVVREFSQDNNWLSRGTIGTESWLSSLNPFTVSEAHAQTPFSIVLNPTTSASGSNQLYLYGGYLYNGEWSFYNTSNYYIGHSNVRPYVYLRLYIPTAGYYTFNFRTYGYAGKYALGDYYGEELESWSDSGSYATYEHPTILELAAGYHYLYFYQDGASYYSTRFLEVTVNSF